MRLIIRILLFVFSLAIVAAAYMVNYTAQLNEFISVAESKKASINEYISRSSSFIDLMSIYGSNYLKRDSLEDSKYYQLIEYDARRDCYTMDSVGGTLYKTIAGNLTGNGSTPIIGLAKSEVCLALEYTKYFESFYQSLPEIAWIHYLSNNSFIYLYPWQSSRTFRYTEDLKDMEYFTFASPKANPQKHAVWTPVFWDKAGKGLMVSLSSPIYYDDTFLGVVSLDLTTTQLKNIIDSEYKSYLVDVESSIIATNTHNEYFESEHKLEELAGFSKSELDELSKKPETTIQYSNGHYFYLSTFENAPWTLYYSVPVIDVIQSAALYSAPLLLISAFLLLTSLISEKRRRTKIELSKSLDQIQAYQKLLENSAKYDFLTDTCNRRGLYESFQGLLDFTGADRPPLSFIIGDIDEFKRFNDTYGHSAGDRVLVEITNILKKHISINDVVCRWGGEEFVIMLAGKTYQDSLLIAEKLRSIIEANIIEWGDSLKLRATMTFGVVEHDYADDLQHSVSKADTALYFGKENGRNRVVGYRDLPVGS